MTYYPYYIFGPPCQSETAHGVGYCHSLGHNAPLITRAEREQQKRHDLEKQQNKWLSVETRWNKWQTKKKEKKEAKKAKLEEKADRAWAKVLEERKQLQDLEEYHRRRYLKKNKVCASPLIID